MGLDRAKECDFKVKDITLYQNNNVNYQIFPVYYKLDITYTEF